MCLTYEEKTHSKVDACDSIHDDEDICICQLLEAEIQASCQNKRHNKSHYKLPLLLLHYYRHYH